MWQVRLEKNGERITGKKRPLAISAEAENHRSVTLDNKLYNDFFKKILSLLPQALGAIELLKRL